MAVDVVKEFFPFAKSDGFTFSSFRFFVVRVITGGGEHKFWGWILQPPLLVLRILELLQDPVPPNFEVLVGCLKPAKRQK